MKKFICLIILALTTSMAFAQVQQGHVKTRGRLTSDGKVITGNDIPDATITLGDGSTFRSGSNGRFTFAVTKGNYYLKNVQKKDYQLCDRDLLGRTKIYSANVLEIAMQTPDEALEDRLESEEKIRATLNRQLSKQKAELKRLKEELKISQQEYNKKLQELYAAQNNNERLISEMAERYSTIDFDQMDDFQRRVAAFIQNGELARADSLLKTKGSMEERSAEFDRLHTANVERRETLEKSESMEATLLDDFAADCYSHYNISIMQHNNDSAAYWLELRASKDTANIEWYLDYLDFCSRYLCEYQKFEDNCKKTISRIEQFYGKNNILIAKCYLYLGDNLRKQGMYNKALEYDFKALEYYQSYEAEHINTLKTYIEIAKQYLSMHDYNKGMEFCKKSLSLIDKYSMEVKYEQAEVYNNLAFIYHEHLDDFDKSLECYQKSLSYCIQALGNDHPDVATVYGNIAILYYDYQKDSLAFENCQKALDINVKIYGEIHPEIATDYNTLGKLHSRLGNDSIAFSNCLKALDIMEECYGRNHPYLSIVYGNIAVMYFDRKQYEKALEYAFGALNSKIEDDEKTKEDYTLYLIIAECYMHLGLYSQANDFFRDAIIGLELCGEDAYSLGGFWNMYADILFDEEQYSLAINYYKEALTYYEKDNSDKDKIANCYNMIGLSLYNQESYELAMKNFNISLQIFKKNNSKLKEANLCNNIGDLFVITNADKAAIKYYRQAITIYEELNNSEDSHVTYNSLGEIYFGISDYKKALIYFQKAYNAVSQITTEDTQECSNTYYSNIGLTYNMAKYKGKELSGYSDFLKSSIWKLRSNDDKPIVDGYQATDDFYILKYGDWEMDSLFPIAIEDNMDVILWRDGIIITCKIENCEKLSVYPRYITEEQKQIILNDYNTKKME